MRSVVTRSWLGALPDASRQAAPDAQVDRKEVIAVPTQSPTKKEGAVHTPARGDEVTEPRTLDVRGRTITTAIALAAHEELASLEVGDELELETDPLSWIVPDLKAWCRASGHDLVEVRTEGQSFRLRLRKGERGRDGRQVAVVASSDGLEELLSPLGFALAGALGGARVAVYLQGPAVRVLAPGFRAKLHGLGRPFSRFARAGLEKTGHVAPDEKLRQLQALGAELFACGPSLTHFKVDPERLDFDHVVVCEYLTFLEVMQRADVQLYA